MAARIKQSSELTKESKLRPEVHNPKEREVDVDPIEEVACHAGCADVLCHRVDGYFRARLDTVAVGAAVRLLIGESGTIAEGLRAVGSILWRDHHDDGIVECQHDKSEKHCCEEHCLWGCVALADGEDVEPEAGVAVSDGTW